MRQFRLSPQTIQVLQTFLQTPKEWKYGYEISRELGLKSGTLYPILIRLAQHKLLETDWEEATEAGRPPRHIYRVTAEGVRFARERLPERSVRRMPKPALGRT